MSFDQNILTAESFKNPEIMEFMKNQYEVSIREDQKQKLDLKKARKEPVPTPKSSVEVTKIEESYSSLSRSDNDYGGNHYSG
jgi:hypothetical protein